jgi:phenylacetic acid degradation operon negative regulatory protein
MGIKERRTKILVALFLLSDLSFLPVILDEKVQKIFDMAINQKTRATLASLLKEGSIQKQGENSYSLTEKGFVELALQFPYCRFLRDKWDGKWRILSYEIPETKRELRDKLRRQVTGWGLGPWHRSFWLTPHPIVDDLRKLVSGREEEKFVQAFESSHVFGDQEVLIEKVWARSELEKKYRELFKQWHLILSQNEDKLDKLRKVVNEYVALLREDPGLPTELIGSNWIGHQAFNIYKEIRGILLA